jgi:hypothetical protein
VLGVFVDPIGDLREIAYQVEQPFVVSHERFSASFDLEPTPHREAIEETLAWYEAAN